MSGVVLPEGWCEVCLENIVSDVSYGYTAKSTDSEVGPKFLRITDIQDNSVNWKTVPFCNIDDEGKQKYLLKAGDLVFARTGATVGKSFLIRETPPDSVYASYLIRVRSAYSEGAEYLAHFFRSPEYWHQITDFSSGIGQPNVNGTKLKMLNVPFASVAEQKEIVVRVNDLLAQVDSIRARLDAIPGILKSFRQSTLEAAVNGSLVGNGEKNEWRTVPLSQAASHIVDCPHSTPKWSESGKYCVRTTGFNPFSLDLSEQGFVSEQVYQERIKRLRPEPHDILYSREGTVGIACQIPEGIDLCMGQRMVLIRAADGVLDKYLTLVLNSDHILSIVRDLTIGSTAPRVNMKDIKNYPIPLPPISEQSEIVTYAMQLLTFANQVEQQVENAKVCVNKLTKSILAKAFQGELTAEWRRQYPELITAENSAKSLLDKIQLEREKLGPKKRTRSRKA